MLTFEYDEPGSLEVTFDAAGRDDLLRMIQHLVPGDHEHLSTPSWGGHQLTEAFPNPDLTPIHQATFAWVEPETA